LWKQVYGKGVEVPFPGTEKGWMSTHSDTNLDLLAKMEIYAALNPEMCGGGRAFNIADGRTVRWAEVWPGLCEGFGLLGVGPTDGGEGIVDFVERNERVWEGLVKREGLRGEPFGEQNWGLVHFMLVDFWFDRELVFPVVNFEILHCKGRFVRCGAAASRRSRIGSRGRTPLQGQPRREVLWYFVLPESILKSSAAYERVI
jgi:hypothetical protein